MNLKLTDKIALVSGSTKGIGFAVAIGLAREGAQVIVNGRSEKAVADAKERCSPLAAATNGAALRVDGGVVRACF